MGRWCRGIRCRGFGAWAVGKGGNCTLATVSSNKWVPWTVVPPKEEETMVGGKGGGAGELGVAMFVPKEMDDGSVKNVFLTCKGKERKWNVMMHEV